jgi:8-oxo-dGTP pyrophosphatase MutT (NUDIX family)
VKAGRPAPIAVSVEVVQDLSEMSRPLEGYLRRRRVRARTVLSDGLRTDPYVVDWVERAHHRRDAAAVVLFTPAASPGTARVLLRRQVRVPLHQVLGEPLCLELVAGLREDDEPWTRCARRETHEEAGLWVDEGDFFELGPPIFPVPASFTEQIVLFGVEVPDLDHAVSGELLPPGDGSPLEAGADLWVVSLEEALALCETAPKTRDDGLFIADAKTEIGLRRLHARLARGAA